MDYNLNDNVEDSFKFQVGGHSYIMRYPLVEELEELQDLYIENKKKERSGEVANNDELNAKVYAFISPVDNESPNIQDLLKGQSVKVMQNFNKMVSEELGIS